LFLCHLAMLEAQFADAIGDLAANPGQRAPP
jgi:hypothetical protein